MTKKKKSIGTIEAIVTIATIAAIATISLLSISHGKQQDVTGKQSITVMTYNTQRMGMFAKPNKNKVIRYVQQQKADIVFLQEVDVYKDEQFLTFSELKEAMRDKYRYSYYDFKIYDKRHQYGIVVYSKYPLINKQTIRYTSRGNISNLCDVVVGKDTFRLFNNHLESNHLEAVDLPHQLEKERIKESAHKISDKLESAREIRHAQVAAIREEISKSPYPVIVAGDFNDVPFSWTYLKMRGVNLQDCFLKGCRGQLGGTFRKHGVGVRIDYILCSQSFTPSTFKVERINYSDHYPIYTTLWY